MLTLSRRIFLGSAFAWACAASSWGFAAEKPQPELVEHREIWSEGKHNAFTDLIRFQGNWYCGLREGDGHVSAKGALRIIRSTDEGKTWESVKLITSDLGDLRDAKFSIAPSGELVLNSAVALTQPAEYRHQSLAWFSPDGTTWSDELPIADKNYWLWEITWNGDQAYGVGYSTDSAVRMTRLYQSGDGKNYKALVPELYGEGFANEHSILFQEDGTAICLLRKDSISTDKEALAVLGTAQPPYTDWSWKTTNKKVGGPEIIKIPDGRIVAVVRLYDAPHVRTSLCWVNPETAELQEFLTLPSGGDTSYAGLVWHDDLLWISYYSSHEGKSKIYLAKVAFPDAK